jgi:hypothetical protein
VDTESPINFWRDLLCLDFEREFDTLLRLDVSCYSWIWSVSGNSEELLLGWERISVAKVGEVQPLIFSFICSISSSQVLRNKNISLLSF